LIIATHLSSSHKKAQKAQKEKAVDHVLFVLFCGNLFCLDGKEGDFCCREERL